MPAGVVFLEPSDLVGKLAALRERGEHPKEILEVIAESFVTRVSEEWDTAGHGTWKPLAESTKKKRRGNSYEILKNHGRAAQSARPEVGDDFAEAATDVSYMVFHVSAEPRKIIPLRNPFDIPQDAFDEATEMLAAWVVR